MLRTIIWFIWFGMSLIISTPFIFLSIYLEKKGRISEKNALVYKVGNIWASSLLKVAGVKVTVHGIENIPKDKPVLFIGNHQGNFDIPIYISQIPQLIGFIAKIELGKIPVLKTWMELMQCVFMDRSNIRKSGEAIIKGIKNLKSGYSMVIFPEGTRSRGDIMGQFKLGSFKLASKSKCPIIPVTMNGSYKIMENNKKSLIKPAKVELYIHPLIDTSNLSKEEFDLLPGKVYDIISQKLPH